MCDICFNTNDLRQREIKEFERTAVARRDSKISLSLNALFVIMKKTVLTTLIFGCLTLLIGLTGCKNDDPSIAKVYVKSQSDQLVTGAKVIIIGDVDNPTTTVEYVDTMFTNSSGFAQFDMGPYFDKAGKENSVGVFDIIIRSGEDYGDTSGFRCRVHNTAVTTVYFEN